MAILVLPSPFTPQRQEENGMLRSRTLPKVPIAKCMEEHVQYVGTSAALHLRYYCGALWILVSILV